MTFDSVIAGSPRSRSPRRGWDVALTVVLLVLLVPLTALGVFAGAFLVMASDSCGAAAVCNESTLSLGVLVSMCAPIVVFVVTGIVAILRLYRGRIAFWVPLVGAVLMVVVWVGGAAITAVSVAH